jgi:predicted acyltransferase
MILVNNPRGWQHIYSPLALANWHGWTLTDLIFPFLSLLLGVYVYVYVYVYVGPTPA